MTFRVAEHQRQTEQFEAEEEHQHARIQQGRHRHRQADMQRHLQRVGADHARGFFHIGTETLQRRRRIQIDVRHVRQAGDDRDAGQRIDIPRHGADQVLCPQRVETDRSHRDDVAEREHHRRNEDRDQHQHFDHALSGQVGAGQQEGECRTQRQRDDHHAECDHHRVAQRRPEIGVIENERVRVEAEMLDRIEERRVEKALPEDQRQRRKHHQRGDRYDRSARKAEGAGTHVQSTFY